MTTESFDVKEMEEAVDNAVAEMTPDGQAPISDATVEETTTEEVTVEEADIKEVTEETTDADTVDKTRGEDPEGISIEEVGKEVGEEIQPPIIPEPGLGPQFSDEILARAVQAGLSLSEARTFSHEGSLEHTVSLIEAGKKTETTKEDPLDSLPKLDPEVYEPEVVDTFNKLTDVVRQQRDELNLFKSAAQQSAEAAQGAATREIEGWFDERVNNLGENFSEVLGKGEYASLNQGSTQLAKRDQIINHMTTLVAGLQTTGQQLLSRDAVFEVASRAVLQDEFQKIHEEKLVKELADRSTQHISRPGGQKVGGVQSVDEETAAMIDSKFGK